MSIISAVKTFIATCPSLEAGALLSVDHLGSDAIQYAIISLPGQRVISEYLNGGSLRQFPFAFQAMALTADDQERIDNAGFFEGFRRLAGSANPGR